MAEDNNFRGYWYNSSAQKDRQVVLSDVTTLRGCKTPSKVGCQVESLNKQRLNCALYVKVFRVIIC